MKNKIQDHDCHASPEDGCEYCDRFSNEYPLGNMAEPRDIYEEAKITDGLGILEEIDEFIFDQVTK